MNRPLSQYAKGIGLAAHLLLMLGLVAQNSVLAWLAALLLVPPLPGLVRGRLYTYQWASMLVVFYCAMWLAEGWADPRARDFDRPINERGEKGALGAHRGPRDGVVQLRTHRGHPCVVLPDLDRDRALPRRRQPVGRLEVRADMLPRVEPVQPRRGQDGRVYLAAVHLLQAGADVAAQLAHQKVGTFGTQLRRPARHRHDPQVPAVRDGGAAVPGSGAAEQAGSLRRQAVGLAEDGGGQVPQATADPEAAARRSGRPRLRGLL